MPITMSFMMREGTNTTNLAVIYLVVSLTSPSVESCWPTIKEARVISPRIGPRSPSPCTRNSIFFSDDDLEDNDVLHKAGNFSVAHILIDLGSGQT